jgi:hypothetical protein
MENYEDNPEDRTDTVEYKHDENNLEYGNYNHEDHINTPNDGEAVDVDMGIIDHSNHNTSVTEQPLVKKKAHLRKTVVINNEIGEHEHPKGQIEIQKHHNLFVKNEIDQKVTHSPGESVEDSILDDLSRLFYTVFNKANIILMIWFLAIYFICYYLIGIAFKKNVDDFNYQTRLSKMLDIVLLCFFLLFLIASYYSIPNIKKQDILESTATKTVEFIENTTSLAVVSFFIIFFYVVVYLFRIPMTYETKPFFVSMVESGAWILLLVIVFVQFFQIVFNLNMMDAIRSFLDWSSLPFHSHDKPNNSSLATTIASAIQSATSMRSTSGNSSYQTTGEPQYPTYSMPGNKGSSAAKSNNQPTKAPELVRVSFSDNDNTGLATATPTSITTTPTSNNKQGFVGNMKSVTRLSYDTTEDLDASHWTNLYAYNQPLEKASTKHNPYINFGKSKKSDGGKQHSDVIMTPLLAKSENDIILENKIRKWNGNLADRNVIVNVYDNGRWK